MRKPHWCNQISKDNVKATRRGSYNLAMSLMRLTFQNRDYSYSILTKRINKDTIELKINLRGGKLTLVRSPNKERDCQEPTSGDTRPLLKAIGKSIFQGYPL